MTDLPSGWEWTTLGDLAAPEERAITDGPFGSNLKSEHYTESGARVFRLQNIGDGFFRDERSFISLDHFVRLKRHEAREGDLLVASLGERPPRVCLVPPMNEPAIVKADCIRVRLSSRVDRRWVLYMLQAPLVKQYASALIKGVGRPRLGLEQIRNIPLPLAPSTEQRRIVASLEDHLSRIDAGASGLKHVSRRLLSLRMRILVEAVPIAPRTGWRIVPTGQAGAVDLGRQRHPDWHTGPNMRPYLRVANVFEDRIDLGDVMEMDFPPEVFDRYKLTEGDILLNEGQSPEYLGRPAMYRGHPQEIAFTNSLLRFRAHEDVRPEWALLVFRRHMHAGRFMQEVRITTNIAHLSASRFKSVEFPIPPLEEQDRIVAETIQRMIELDRIAGTVESAIKRSGSLRSALLAEAFSGRLVPQDPDDEPAAVLLERIKAERAALPKSKRTRRVKTTKPVQGTLL